MKNLQRLAIALVLIAATSTVAWAAVLAFTVTGTATVLSQGPPEVEIEDPSGTYDAWGIPVEIQLDGDVQGTALFYTEIHVDAWTGNGTTRSFGSADITYLNGEAVSLHMTGRSTGDLAGWITSGRTVLTGRDRSGHVRMDLDMIGYIFGPWDYSGDVEIRRSSRHRWGEDGTDHDDDDHEGGRKGRKGRGRG